MPKARCFICRARFKTSALDFDVQAVSGQSTEVFAGGGPLRDRQRGFGCAGQGADQAIRGGATALAIVHSSQAKNLQLWLDAPELFIADVKSKDYGLPQSLKLDHPVLSVFRDSRFSDFTNLHFWNYRELQSLPSEGVEVLARFDTGLPAWLHVLRDEGRLMVMTAGWRPSDSQLCTRPSSSRCSTRFCNQCLRQRLSLINFMLAAGLT